MKRICFFVWLLLAPGLVFSQTSREVPQPVVDSLQSLKVFAYANDPAYWVIEEPQPSAWAALLSRLFAVAWFRRLLIIALAGALLFLFVRMILHNKLAMFSRRGARLKPAMEEEQETAGYHRFITDAERQADFRSAVRYQFLFTLDLLKKGDWIQWRTDGTNREYLNQLKKQKWQPEFLQLTRLFEKVWYGGMPVAGDQYDRFRQQFTDFNKRLS